MSRAFEPLPRPLAWLGCLTLLGCAACGNPPAEDQHPASQAAESPSSQVVAETDDGPVTVADLERFVGELGPAYQPAPHTPAAERYAALARRLTLERLLYEEALDAGADRAPEIESLDRLRRVEVYSEHFLRSLPPLEPITEEQVRERFATAKARFDRAEKRRVSHIFLRYDSDRDADRREVRERLQDLRRQILDGQPFALLAREHSQSETRHRNGTLGFVERGLFPPDFDRVVFALEPEVPSEVLSTADGAHLFYVHNVLAARDVSFEEIRQLLLFELRLEQGSERLRQVAADLPRDDLEVVDRSRLLPLLRQAPDERVLFRAGDVTLTAGELRTRTTAAALRLGDLADPELPARLFDELLYRTLIYRDLESREDSAEALGVTDDGLEAAHRQQVVDHYARRKLRERLEADEATIDRHYAQNVMRFATPLQLEIQRLAVDPGTAGSAVMARLEAARDELDRGRLALAELGTELGGRLRSFGPISIGQLQAIDPPAVRFAALLQPGEHSPPYVASDGLAIFRVVRRTDPQPQPLAEVREPVIADYLTHHSARLFAELADEMLATAGFELVSAEEPD